MAAHSWKRLATSFIVTVALPASALTGCSGAPAKQVNPPGPETEEVHGNPPGPEEHEHANPPSPEPQGHANPPGPEPKTLPSGGHVNPPAPADDASPEE